MVIVRDPDGNVEVEVEDPLRTLGEQSGVRIGPLLDEAVRRVRQMYGIKSPLAHVQRADMAGWGTCQACSENDHATTEDGKCTCCGDVVEPIGHS